MAATSVKHAFTSAKADGADATLVKPSNWNAAHTLTEIVQPRVQGLLAVNNATTPNTKLDLTSATSIVFRDTNGLTYTRFNQGVLTCDTGLAGPAIQGRDQAGAFGASTWLYFYYIYNPTTDTVASTVSTSIPTAGPALPTGYTAWALACIWRFNASSILPKGYQRGSQFYYQDPVTSATALSNGSSATEVTVDVSTFVPPTPACLSYQLANRLTGTISGAGDTTAQLNIRLVTTVNYWIHLFEFPAQGATLFDKRDPLPALPNIGQAFIYLIAQLNLGGSLGAYIFVTGYTIANGDG